MTKKGTISIYAFMIFVAFVFTGVFHYLCLDSQITRGSVRLLCVWGAIVYVLCLHSLRKTAKKISFAYVWLLITVLFFYSQYICYAINIDMTILPQYVRVFDSGIDSRSIIGGFFFPLECLIVICCYFCIRYPWDLYRYSNESYSKEDNYQIEKDSMRIVSRVIFYTTIIPTIYYCSFSIIANRTYGYSTMKYMLGEGLGRGSLLFWAAFLSGWFEVACYMLCISTRNKHESIFVRICLLLYAIGIVLAGSRYKALEILCGYILIDYYWFNRTNKKRLIAYIILGIIAIIGFSAVRYLRIESYQTMDYSFMSKQMITDALLGDSSATGRINCAVMQIFDNGYDFGYGISYLNGVIAILPSVLRNAFFPDLQMDITGNVLSLYSGTTVNSLGSSFCAEAYYNFGMFSLLIMIFYGFILSKVTAIHDTVLKNLSPNRFVLYVYISTQMIFCIRSEVSSIFRPIVYYVLIPIAICSIITSLSRHN